LESTGQSGLTNTEPPVDTRTPWRIEARISAAFLGVGLASLAALVIYSVWAFLHLPPLPKSPAPVAIHKPPSPTKKLQASVAKRTIIAPHPPPADHPVASEAEKRPLIPAIRDLLDRGWALVAPPYSTIRWQQARQDFEQALKTDAESNEARIGLAHVLGAKLSDQWSPVLQVNPPRAEELLTQVLKKGGASKQMAQAHYELGLVYQMQNRLVEARVEFTRSLELDPDNARTHLHLGESLMYLGDPECPSFEDAIRLSPHGDSITAMNYWALGTCHLLLNDADRGIVELDKAKVADNHLWVPYLYLAAAYGMKNDPAKARSSLDQSLKRRPPVNSLERMRAENPWLSNQNYWALQETTLNRGLRQAGLPDH
jgi:tetratricopeptide (TPR) repeat protein